MWLMFIVLCYIVLEINKYENSIFEGGEDYRESRSREGDRVLVVCGCRVLCLCFW